MKIRKATTRDYNRGIQIARSLKKWFTKEAVNNMKIDFYLNNLIVAVEKKDVVGFICYTSNNGVMHLLWMGVKKESHGKGVGKSLLELLVKESKKLGLRSIEVETLPDEVEYEPYRLTRNFYYRNGFKRVAYKKARVKGWDDQIILKRTL